MTTAKSFADLYAKRRATPAYHAEELAVTFLAELNEVMKERGVSNADLARRLGASSAYITKVFRGPSNLSVETLAKLAMALDCRVSLHAREQRRVSWTEFSRETRPSRQWPAKDAFTAANFGEVMEMDRSNDESFALAA